MALKKLWLSPKNITQGMNILRDMTSLETIGVDDRLTCSAAEFWQRYDKGEFK
jgi:hypothetical protein